MSSEDETAGGTMPDGQWCPIGPLSLHTYNYERDECIWCGPNQLAWKPGRWIPTTDGCDAWSALPITNPPAAPDQTGGV